MRETSATIGNQKIKVVADKYDWCQFARCDNDDVGFDDDDDNNDDCDDDDDDDDYDNSGN